MEGALLSGLVSFYKRRKSANFSDRSAAQSGIVAQDAGSCHTDPKEMDDGLEGSSVLFWVCLGTPVYFIQYSVWYMKNRVKAVGCCIERDLPVSRTSAGCSRASTVLLHV